jgi:hypothetical protein
MSDPGLKSSDFGFKSLKELDFALGCWDEFFDIYKKFCEKNGLSDNQAWDVLATRLIMLTSSMSTDHQMFNDMIKMFIEKSRNEGYVKLKKI